MTREEAIKRLNKIKAIYRGMDNKSDVKALDMAIKALSAEKTASWVGLDDYPHEDWECDNCGYVLWEVEEPYRFCPNCGRRMLGEQTE